MGDLEKRWVLIHQLTPYQIYIQLIKEFLIDNEVSSANLHHASLSFHKDGNYKTSKENNVGDGKHYLAELELEEMESRYQYEVFIFLFILISLNLSSILLIIFLTLFGKASIDFSQRFREKK